MTSSNDRLNQIEVLLAATVQITRSNAMAIASNSAAIAEVRNATETTRASVDGLMQTITEFSIKTSARLNKLDETIAEIKATNQNLERILVQLVRDRT